MAAATMVVAVVVAVGIATATAMVTVTASATLGTVVTVTQITVVMAMGILTVTVSATAARPMPILVDGTTAMNDSSSVKLNLNLEWRHDEDCEGRALPVAKEVLSINGTPVWLVAYRVESEEPDGQTAWPSCDREVQSLQLIDSGSGGPLATTDIGLPGTWIVAALPYTA